MDYLLSKGYYSGPNRALVLTPFGARRALMEEGNIKCGGDARGRETHVWLSTFNDSIIDNHLCVCNKYSLSSWKGKYFNNLICKSHE